LRNPFRVITLVMFSSQGCRFASNPGLKLANAFGVTLWLFGSDGQKGHSGLFVALDHAIEGAPVDAEDFGGAGAIAAGDLEDVEEVTSFELVERGQIFEEC